jgi:hypothetical protein
VLDRVWAANIVGGAGAPDFTRLPRVRSSRASEAREPTGEGLLVAVQDWNKAGVRVTISRV